MIDSTSTTLTTTTLRHFVRSMLFRNFFGKEANHRKTDQPKKFRPIKLSKGKKHLSMKKKHFSRKLKNFTFNVWRKIKLFFSQKIGLVATNFILFSLNMIRTWARCRSSSQSPKLRRVKKLTRFISWGENWWMITKSFLLHFFFISSWATAVFCPTKNNVVSLFTIKWSC